MKLTELGIGLTIYFGVIAFLLGTVFGSFLNCAAWRIARGQSFVKGRSVCPACGHTLGVRDLVPLISYGLSKGKCRHCGSRISPRYPITEAIFGLCSLALFLADGLTPLYLRDFAFVCCLFCLSLVDMEISEIPDGSLLIAVIAWAVYLPFAGYSVGEIVLHIAAGAVFLFGFLLVSLVMDRVLGRESMGGGDIKLIGVIALYFGFVGTLFVTIFACVVGLVGAIFHHRRAGQEAPIPFGPFLSAAAFLMLLFGEGLVDWYMQRIF